MQTQEPLLNKKQTAKWLNVSDASIERLMRRGLRYVKLNGLVRFRPGDLAEYIDQNTRGGAAA